MPKSKLPSFQFYPGDWMKDPALAICSAGARGVWMDVMCLMFESPKRGYLITNGVPWTIEQIAVSLRGDWQENLVYLKERPVRNGVMKQATHGHLFRGKVGAFYRARIAARRGTSRGGESTKTPPSSLKRKRVLPPNLFHPFFIFIFFFIFSTFFFHRIA